MIERDPWESLGYSPVHAGKRGGLGPGSDTGLDVEGEGGAGSREHSHT